jgi:hypothetical protein
MKENQVRPQVHRLIKANICKTAKVVTSGKKKKTPSQKKTPSRQRKADDNSTEAYEKVNDTAEAEAEAEGAITDKRSTGTDNARA